MGAGTALSPAWLCPWPIGFQAWFPLYASEVREFRLWSQASWFPFLLCVYQLCDPGWLCPGL